MLESALGGQAPVLLLDTDLPLNAAEDPVDAGHDTFPYDLVGRLLCYADIPIPRPLAGDDALNMTYLGLHLSEYVNRVAERHAEVSRKLFPGHHVYAITNGAHASTWTGPCFAALFDRHIPGWRHEPQLLMRADHIADDEVWMAHAAQKQSLIEFVKARLGVTLNPERPIIGFARRMTEYKRPGLLFSDRAVKRLEIASSLRSSHRRPIQKLPGGSQPPGCAVFSTPAGRTGA